MASKKGAKNDNKGASSTKSCVLYFTQFAIEEFLSQGKFGLNIEGQITYLTPKDFNSHTLKPYNIVGPKMDLFISLFYDAIKTDFEKVKFDSKFVKFLQLVKNKQTNVYLFELHKNSQNMTIRTISTLIRNIADQLTANSADSSDDYMTLADLLCVGLSILVFKYSFVTGSQVKDVQGFRRMLADLYSSNYFMLDGSTNDEDLFTTMAGLVTKTFETQSKSTGKKGQSKAVQSQQQVDNRRESNDNDTVDNLLNEMQ